MYDVTLGRFQVTIFAMEIQKLLHIVCVCLNSYLSSIQSS